MENIKKSIKDLLAREIIFNKNMGKEDKMESFKITKDEEAFCDSLTEPNSQDGGEENLESLEQFISESFHEALMNKIIEEIKIAAKDERR